MVTDRCTTACLLCYLCSAYPGYAVYFQAIVSVDLASHYMHMYRYLAYPHSRVIQLANLPAIEYLESRRLVTQEDTEGTKLDPETVLRQQHRFVPVLRLQRTLLRLDLSAILPSATQFSSSSGYAPPKTQRSRANRGVGYIRGIPLSYPYLLAFVTFPICAAKNWINVIQMVNAAHALAEVDKEDRAGAGLVSASRPKRSNAGTKSARKT